LILALLTGAGAEETRRESERTRIIELKTALKHVDRALKTLAPDREDIRSLGGDEDEDEELFVRLADVVRAETLIQNAVKFLIENAKRNYGGRRTSQSLRTQGAGVRALLTFKALSAPATTLGRN